MFSASSVFGSADSDQTATYVVIFIIIVIAALLICHIIDPQSLLVPTILEASPLVLGAGAEPPKYITVHISGPSSAGKSSLGERIKEKFPDTTVIDIDSITGPIMKKLTEARHTENYIKSHYIQYVEKTIGELLLREVKTANVVLVGYADLGNANHVTTPRINVDYKYFIQISDEALLRQKYKRDVREKFCDKICQTNLDFASDPPTIDVYYNPEAIRQHKYTLTRQYQQLKYKFMSGEKIFDEVSMLLRKHS